jgi:tRNA A58 N-methylase Trm61
MKLWTRLTQLLEACCTRVGLLYSLSCIYYRNIIEKEITLASITADDHILCIGGGMCPFSAIMLHEMTGAQVSVIDKDSACIPAAKNMIDRFGYGDKVNVMCCEGAQMEFENYSVVHFALQVSPVMTVFKQAEKNVAPGTRLLVRRPKKSKMLCYCPYITHSARNIGRTLLYVKQDAMEAGA